METSKELSSILEIVKTYKLDYGKRLSNEDCIKVAQVLDILYGEQNSNVKKILDTVSDVIMIYSTVGFEKISAPKAETSEQSSKINKKVFSQDAVRAMKKAIIWLNNGVKYPANKIIKDCRLSELIMIFNQ